MKSLIKAPKTIEEIMRDWMREACVTPTTKVVVHTHNRKVFIITDKPGYFIGLRGWLVEKYQKELRKNGFPTNIQIIDIFTGGLRVF